MSGHRRVLGFPLQPPRLPGFARVGRVPSGRTVELPGRGCTYVVDSGPVPGAPTFMLLHGLACTGLMMWYPALEMMRGLGRVVVFDQRWHGQGISAPRFLLEDCADDVAALADALGVETFVPVVRWVRLLHSWFGVGTQTDSTGWSWVRRRPDGGMVCRGNGQAPPCWRR
jgi:3-oxoadipate enol-lactonase